MTEAIVSDPFEGVPPDPEKESLNNVAQYEGRKVTLIGIGAIINGKARCWKPDGSPDPKLTKEFQTGLKANDEFLVDRGRDRHPEKKFFILMSLDGEGPQELENRVYDEVLGVVGSNGFATFDEVANGWGENLPARSWNCVVKISKDKVGKLASIRYRFAESKGRSVTIPFQLGKVLLDGNEFDINWIDKVPPKWSSEPSFPLDKLGIKVTGTTVVGIESTKVSNRVSSVTFRANNEKAQEIFAVAKDGKLLSKGDADESRPPERLEHNGEAPVINTFPNGEILFSFLNGNDNYRGFKENKRGLQVATFYAEQSKIKTLTVHLNRSHLYLFKDVQFMPR